MTLVPPSELRQVRGITSEQTRRIRDFMQGAVYSWAKNRKDHWFAVRDLVGGDNRNWGGTPLQVLYTKHTASGKTHDKAFEAASHDIGWLTKAVLDSDRREFESRDSGRGKEYRWTGL